MLSQIEGMAVSTASPRDPRQTPSFQRRRLEGRTMQNVPHQSNIVLSSSSSRLLHSVDIKYAETPPFPASTGHKYATHFPITSPSQVINTPQMSPIFTPSQAINTPHISPNFFVNTGHKYASYFSLFFANTNHKRRHAYHLISSPTQVLNTPRISPLSSPAQVRNTPHISPFFSPTQVLNTPCISPFFFFAKTGHNCFLYLSLIHI